jgi:MFS transporter, DHA1 family, multidrug resistance protein
MVGFATGPIFWAPLSELRGRRLPVFISQFGLMVFSFGVATAENLQTVLICRFFGGFFGAAPLAVVAAIFSDIFNNETRGVAITIFAFCVFCGPMVAPFTGGFIVTSHLQWRWTMYLSGILAAAALILCILFLKESYAPVVLIEKADILRRRTKNWGIHAKQEEIEVDFRELLERNFSRPIRMLIKEPIVLLLTIYMSLIYGLLYGFLTAYPLIFQGKYHMSPGVGGLPFLGMATGEFIACVYTLFRQKSYVKKLRANNNIPVPEWRLPDVVIGGVAFTGGLFWLGWSGYTGHVHWIVPTLSGLLSGFGLLAIFLGALNYLVDTYLMVSSTAKQSMLICSLLPLQSPQIRFFDHLSPQHFHCLQLI